MQQGVGWGVAIREETGLPQIAGSFRKGVQNVDKPNIHMYVLILIMSAAVVTVDVVVFVSELHIYIYIYTYICT